MSCPKPQRADSHYSIAAEDLRRNDQQWAAYESPGHCVVLAGPGSGKTKTLTIKIARMLAEDVRPPHGVACVTYNNQCVKELRKRLGKLGLEDGARSFIGTVQSFCLRDVVVPYARLAGLPIPEPLSVAAPREQERLFADAVSNLLGDENPSRVRTPFDEFRRTVLDRSSREWADDDRYAPLIVEYEGLLTEAGKIDFDGMVLMGLKLICEHDWIRKALRAKYPILVVDEYQDLGVPLHGIVLALCFGAGIRLFAVGDPDQSIYGFTGARPALLDELASREDVEAIRLRLNYRCGRTIIAASETALPDSRGFESAGGHEGVVQDYHCPEGFDQQISLAVSTLIPQAIGRRGGRRLGDVGILYQNQGQGAQIGRAAKAAGIPYVRFDKGIPYPRTPLTLWLEDCAGWCAGGWKEGEPRLSGLIHTWFRLNPTLATDSDLAACRKKLVGFLSGNRNPDAPLRSWLASSGECGLWVNLMEDQTVADELDVLRALYEETSEGKSLAECTVANFGGQRGSPDCLNLTTVHSAKGLEYDVAIILGLEEGRFPWTYQATDQSIAESRRLFYVALTRARHEVHLLWSGWYEHKGYRFQTRRSRFVDDVLARIEG